MRYVIETEVVLLYYSQRGDTAVKQLCHYKLYLAIIISLFAATAISAMPS